MKVLDYTDVAVEGCWIIEVLDYRGAGLRGAQF